MWVGPAAPALYFLTQRSFFIANTYNQLKSRLRALGFVRHQYSDYRCVAPRHPIFVWTSMIHLVHIAPPGRLQTNLLSLKMHYLPFMNEMDVTVRVRLGGDISDTLLGATPVGLIPDDVLEQEPAPVIPGPDFIRPRYTRASAQADDPMNYRVAA
jgi:hypothetical protein